MIKRERVWAGKGSIWTPSGSGSIVAVMVMVMVVTGQGYHHRDVAHTQPLVRLLFDQGHDI